MDATEIAAWWGAAVATLVFLWDVFKWIDSGPKINVSSSSNMSSISDGRALDDLNVVVEVQNRGNIPVTITHLVGIHYKSFIHRLLGRRSGAFLVTNPAFSDVFPKMLAPGERWIGGLEQDSEIEQISRSEYLYCGVYHTGGDKPVLSRLRIDSE